MNYDSFIYITTKSIYNKRQKETHNIGDPPTWIPSSCKLSTSSIIDLNLSESIFDISSLSSA